MNNKVSIIGEAIDPHIIDDLNEMTNDCTYEYIGIKGFSVTPGEILIIYELVRNLSYNAIYDFLKLSLSAIISKIKSKNRAEKDTQITVIIGSEKSIMNIPFELTDVQKDKIVDAAITKFLCKEQYKE